MCICMRCALNGNVCPFPFIIQHTLYTSYSDADLGPSAPCYGWSVGAGGWWALANLPSASRHCGHSASSGDLSWRCVPLVHTNSRSPPWLQGSLSWSKYHAKDAFYGAYASPDSPVSAKWQGLIAVLMTNNTFTGLAPWSTTGQCALNQSIHISRSCPHILGISPTSVTLWPCVISSSNAIFVKMSQSLIQVWKLEQVGCLIISIHDIVLY